MSNEAMVGAPVGAAEGEQRASGVRQSSLREHNLAVVSQAIFASTEPVSRAALAAATGMTRSTISRLAEQLLDAQLVVERGPQVQRGPGRPAVPLAPASGSVAGMGLQVNVDYMAGRVIDLGGRVLAEEVVEADFSDSDHTVVLARLGELAAG
ncbi:hypothetical protein PU560_02670, partial [Georgenia sp. 10Sc9-8]|nr:hypothetical protein [Georgenia halotolerans]